MFLGLPSFVGCGGLVATCRGTAWYSRWLMLHLDLRTTACGPSARTRWWCLCSGGAPLSAMQEHVGDLQGRRDLAFRPEPTLPLGRRLRGMDRRAGDGGGRRITCGRSGRHCARQRRSNLRALRWMPAGRWPCPRGTSSTKTSTSTPSVSSLQAWRSSAPAAPCPGHGGCQQS